ncbi:hypothetical protein ASG43_07880 [Aureimonas sp. Leaf454]|uniref:phage tail tape measure protein n=1 Tax=Aureimonas sp. Leaf454 TaxID=1736381 RepID=UPI0006F6BE1C|nr:phage tail tape measure protein [Aureimonas sp. Leaf454]KQT48765.1 hypothetical protein ASG43_07880 [Aureimonas sp. Leaf454]
MARLSSELVLSLTDKVSGPARKMDGVLDKLGRRQRGLASGLDAGSGAVSRTASALGMLGRAGIAGGAAAAVAGSAAAFTQFADVERQLTRTGLKLGATTAQMDEIKGSMKDIAQKYAMPIAEVMAAFDSLGESGFELAEARGALDGMVKATQALGGSGADTVATYDAARKSIKLAAADSERFFDIIAAGGSMGKFEGKDLATYLPSLLPVVAKHGYEGLDGAAKLVGFLEVMRDFVGSSEQAATATADLFEKISSPDVIRNFGKVGVDLEKRLKKARDNGEDVLEVMHDILQTVTGGDASKLSQFFGDVDSRRAADLLLRQYDRVKKAQDELRTKSAGTVEFNVKVVSANAQAEIDRLSNNWDAFVTNVGRGASAIISPALEEINRQVAQSDAFATGVKKEEARGGSQSEAFEEYKRRWQEQNPDKWWGGFNKELQESFARDMQSYGKGEIPSPYTRVDAVKNRDNPGRFPGKADAQAASDAARARQADNIDGGQVRSGGVPVPSSRDVTATPALTEQQQRAEYDRGRRLGEAAVGSRRAQVAAVDDAYRAIQAGLVQPAPAPEAPKAGRVRPSAAMQVIAPPAPAPVAPVQTKAPAAMGPIKPDIFGPVKAEAEAAAVAAEAAGLRVSSAFDVTAKAKVDSTDLDVVNRKISLAISGLQRLGAEARSAQRAVGEAAMSAGNVGRVDYDGLHADTTHPGF